MFGSRLLGFVFVVLGLLVMAWFSYTIITYSGTVIGAIVSFVTTNDYAKLQQCGVHTPPLFAKIQADLAVFILPLLYGGIPLSLIVIAILMFLGGFNFGKAAGLAAADEGPREARGERGRREDEEEERDEGEEEEEGGRHGRGKRGGRK